VECEKYSVYWEDKFKGRDHLGDLGIDGRMILNISNKIRYVSVGWIELAQDRIECKHCDESSDSMKVGSFFFIT
jgi:hypothetical protein